MKHRDDLTRGVPLPSTWVNAIMEMVGSGRKPVLEFYTGTVVRIVAGPGSDQVALPIDGKWRFNSSTVSATHPGGAAGIYDVWATGYANDLSAVDPADDTNYSFGLVIRARSGGNPDPPPATGATAISRRVGEVLWSGSSIDVVVDLLNKGHVPTAWGLPASAPAGQAVDYVVHATNGEFWRLRYNEWVGDNRPWVFVGGSEYRRFVPIHMSQNLGGSYTEIHPDARVTVPVSGYYVVRFGARLTIGDAGAHGYLAPKFGAAAVELNDAAVVPGSGVTHVERTLPQRLLTAGTQIQVHGMRSPGGTAFVQGTFISLLPLRLAATV